MKHTPLTHSNCDIRNCCICDGGLTICTVCGGAEGGLPTDCTGERMTEEQHEAVFEGKLDYKDGEGWIRGRYA